MNGVDAFAPLNKSGTQIGAANLFIPGSPPHLPASANFNKINKNKLPYFFFFFLQHSAVKVNTAVKVITRVDER